VDLGVFTVTALYRPDVKELAQRLKAEISYRALNGAPVYPMSAEDVMASVFAGALFTMYGTIDQKYRDLDPATASCDALYEWASRRGLFPQAAQPAIGFIQITGTPGTSVPLDSRWVSSAGRDYILDNVLNPQVLVIPNSGVLSVKVRSLAAGSLYNLNSGAGLTLAATTPGIVSSAVVVGSGIGGGHDIENCEAFRKRVLLLRRNGVVSTNLQWLLSKATEYPGVTRACVSKCDGCCDDGWIDLFVFFDGVYPNGVAPDHILNQVNEWLFGTPPGAGKGQAPIGLAGAVQTQVAVPVTVTVDVARPLVAETEQYISNVIVEYFKEICVGGTLCKRTLSGRLAALKSSGCIGTAQFSYPYGATEDSLFLRFQCVNFPILAELKTCVR
jgi:uncharacterized phage protein gp47/JayE